MESEQIKQKKVWKFSYKGINCEVVNWNIETPWEGHPSGNWNGYIYIKAQQLPDKFHQILCKKRKTILRSMPWTWDYYKLEDIFNMKGGITYYEVIRGEFNGKKIGIKVGNDYMHSWDVDQRYDESDVIADLKNSVDSFIKSYPGYLVWNIKDGSYTKPENL